MIATGAFAVVLSVSHMTNIHNMLNFELQTMHVRECIGDVTFLNLTYLQTFTFETNFHNCWTCSDIAILHASEVLSCLQLCFLDKCCPCFGCNL